MVFGRVYMEFGNESMEFGEGHMVLERVFVVKYLWNHEVACKDFHAFCWELMAS